ncbi:MSL complex subunit 3-like [Saccoglossus kowalevskii]|uniref:Male-specific lethal 3 homolog n=1 Tax=Saccoglossus kowalevskii TaxID=10224 RepID=A0ABM0GQA1_SACKO|nr:PREDICTED: male-specific lethal 3 homolog [Saccoglossus kowalevskii]
MSNRGLKTPEVKPQFVVGEKVLCFEPDPTKAKVLYDSKVLEVDWTKDEKGKTVPEYLIHFFGWNNSWDRWAPEDYVLKDTPETRDYQDTLQKEAAEKIKQKKKKKKLADIIKESQLKKLKQDESCESDGSEKSMTSQLESEADLEPHDIPINIPDTLKTKLEDDCYYINTKKQLLRLPRQPNIVTLLESYVRYFAMSVHISEKHRPQASTNVVHGLYPHKFDAPHVVTPDHNVDLVKEIMEGLKLIFDFSLPVILLYESECHQFTTVSTAAFIPVHPVKKEREDCDVTWDPEITFKSTTRGKTKRSASPPQLTSLTTKTVKKEKEKEVEEPEPTSTRRITRRQSTELKLTDKIVAASTGRSCSPLTGRRRTDAKHTSDSPSLDKPMRSSARQTHQPMVAKPVTGQSGQTFQQTFQQSVFGASSHQKESSSSISIGSSPGVCEISSCTWNLRDCTDVMGWTLLPKDFAIDGPTPPSLIYGPMHLLRMFVKLPEILGLMHISPKTLKPLVKHLEAFLKYVSLPDHIEEMFPESAYVDVEEVYGNFKKPVPIH